MKKFPDIRNISRLIYMFIICLVIGVAWYSLDGLAKNNRAKDEINIADILDKALVQCYALEGSYPSDIFYLEKYGIIFNEEKYLYYYEPFGQMRPVVKVIDLETETEY